MQDRSNKNFNDDYLKHNVMHEWSHFNIYQITLYNPKPEDSLREGWCLFVGDLYLHEFDRSNKSNVVITDTTIQSNKEWFGINNKRTVQEVFNDLADASQSNDENFHLTQRFIDDTLSESEIEKINLGFMHNVLIQSKANNLKEFLEYYENNYVFTVHDKQKFGSVLTKNGLNPDSLNNTDLSLFTVSDISFTNITLEECDVNQLDN